METIKIPFYARLALILLALLLVLFILTVGADIFIPLLFALLVSILLYPLNKFLEHNLRLGRLFAPLVSVVFMVTSLLGFFYFFAVQLVIFSDDVPLLKRRFTDIFHSLQHWLSHKLHITTTQQTQYIDKYASGFIESIGRSLSSAVFSVSGTLLLLLFIFIFTFFMLYYRRLLMQFIQDLFKESDRHLVTEVIIETKTMINAYISGLVIEMFLVGITTCVTFLVMGVHYAILLSIIVAVLNIIPYLGFYTAICLCMLVTFANSDGGLALQAGIALLVIHLVDANVLFPRIVGGRVKMNPFVTIIAVIIGEKLWGIPGMFLFIPVMGIIKLVSARVEGLKAWSTLIGVEEPPVKPKKIKVNNNPPATE